MGSVRSAVQRIPAGIDHAEAAASLGVFEARRALGQSDWRAPLLEARPLIPGSDRLILVRDLGAPIFGILARMLVPFVAVFIVAVASLVTLLALWLH
jgi:hypothetical protein